jgi:hypothetical protein
MRYSLSNSFSMGCVNIYATSDIRYIGSIK